VVILTTPAGAERLRPAARDADVEIVSAGGPSARLAIEYLRREWNARTISVEAGPTTSRSLYDRPVSVDELLLTTYEGPLPDAAVGPSFLDTGRIASLFPQAGPSVAVDEPSGRWRFQRYLR
jgi:riboflavin biosynthesis pyrimidine reductase